MSLISVKNLSKHYQILNRREGLIGSMKDLFSTDYNLIKAVDGISFEIDPGEIVGYIGPNGAGKSTTIKMMTGILQPTGGELLVNNNIPFKNRKKNAQNMGVIFGQRTQLWWDLPVIESFKILKEIYRVDDQTYTQQMALFNDLVNLQELYVKPVRNLSLGQRMLCDITAAFLHNPNVVFLDEPTIGLDVSVKSKIRTVIKTLNQKHKTTIILTTHDISDVEALCQRIIIIDKGKVIFDDDTKKVTRLFGAYRTLKVQIFPFEDNTVDNFRLKLSEHFGEQTTMTVETIEPTWVDITFNQDEVPLLDVLNFVMLEFPVKDIKIAEISTENVVQQIYDGALA